MADITLILAAAEAGDREAAADLLPLVYDELAEARRRADGRREARPDPPSHRPGPRGVPAARRATSEFDGRGHFFAAAAEAMRRILVEAARRKAAGKRGGGRVRVELPETPAGPGRTRTFSR